MATTFGKATTLPEIVTALKLRISTITDVESDFVYMSRSVRSDLLRTHGSNRYSIRINTPDLNDIRLMSAPYIGGGNSQLALSLDLGVDIMSSLGIDQQSRDDEKILNESLGIVAKMKQLILALSSHALMGVDSATQSLLRQPAKLKACGFAPVAMKTYVVCKSIYTIEWNEDME